MYGQRDENRKQCGHYQENSKMQIESRTKIIPLKEDTVISIGLTVLDGILCMSHME